MNRIDKIDVSQFKGAMSSKEIADITEKKHFHIMRDIRNIISQLSDNECQSNFGLTYYEDSQGKEREMYFLSKKGCLCLASGYDAGLRMKIINRWEELELKERNNVFSVPTSFSEALQLAADQARKIEEQQKVIDYQEPLAVLGDAVMEYDNDITIRELSKILCQNGVDTGEIRLREQFKVEKYLNQDGLPSQRSIENGWLAIAKRTYDHPKYGMQISRKAVVTPKGQKYFVNKFLKSRQYAN